MRWFDRVAPENDPEYTHTSEGPDDMPSHLKAAITRSSEQLPVKDGRLALGTWQGVFIFEHRTKPHQRTVSVRVWD
jgi:secondary thiamine-phosphate synthase enzyme